MKTIAISNTINGTKTIVETNATTLGELKQFMHDNNISYPEDALWYSGLTKSRLEFENSEFLSENPRTCNINGEDKCVHGVILIVPSKNKIESGAMTRGEAYIFICDNNLKEEVKERFGKNYTNVPTDDLIEFISEYDGEPEDDDDEPCDGDCENCDLEIRTPFDALRFIHKALGKVLDQIERHHDEMVEKNSDDLDKMLKDLR